MGAESAVLDMARDVGFDMAGITPLAPPRAASRFAEWLDAGRHGGMTWLERNRERIVDPGRLLEGGRSILVVGLAYSRAAVELHGGGRVARYAAGRDYHNVMGNMLRKLARGLERAGLAGKSRGIVDAGPLLERSHGAQAGLGFESKAANLLHPRFGPWFFLGELLLDVELAPTEEVVPGSCGTCTACLDACPTGAVLEPGLVDARECISYHTIENRGTIPANLRPKFGDWVFGCDVCSEVCPWGRHSGDLSARFGTHSAIAEAGLVEWLEAGESLSERLNGSPLKRPSRAGLARNAAIGLGNRPTEAGRRALLHALTFDPAAIVREAAAWSLAHAHGEDREATLALERAGSVEKDDQTRRSIASWRAACR